MTLGSEDLVPGLIWYVVFLFSIVIHEAAHAWAAWKLGDPTAYRGGQVTLDPLPHMRRAPAGMILVPVLSYLAVGWMFGWAGAPYNPFWARSFPRKSALMALAGPAANLALLLVAALVIRVGVSLGHFEVPASLTLCRVVTAESGGLADTLATLFNILFSLNLILILFNLMPFPPLDGGAILPLFLERNLARRYLDFMSRPASSVVGLVIAWWIFPHLFEPAYAVAIRLLLPAAGAAV